MMIVENRKEIEKLIYDTFDAIDPSHINTNKYKSIFENMNDNEFANYFKELLSDDLNNFILDIVEYENDLQMENIEKCAKVLGIPLYEDVYLPHLTMDKKKVVKYKQKALVAYMNVKRTQQLLAKKNGISISNEKVSAATNQVVDKDKNARDSDIEASMLVALGADAILQELHGPRSDDTVMKREMNDSINNKGYVSLEDLTNVSTNKVTLNTINAYLLAMGLKSDLVSDTYILPKLSAELFE